jgi:hypothetical protein
MCYVGTEKEHILHAESYNKILAWRKKDAKKYHNAPFSTSITPCWSLTALLEFMSSMNMIKGNKVTINCGNHFTKNYNNPLDAAFEMVVWLIEQGHIKVNK